MVETINNPVTPHQRAMESFRAHFETYHDLDGACRLYLLSILDDCKGEIPDDVARVIINKTMEEV